MATIPAAAFGAEYLSPRASWGERLAAAGLPPDTPHLKVRATNHLGSRVAQHRVDEAMIAVLLDLDPEMLADPDRANLVAQKVRSRLASRCSWRVR